MLSIKTFFIMWLLILVVPVPKVSAQYYTVIGDMITWFIDFTRLSTNILPSYSGIREKKQNKYDFIIVGSGPSGSVVANRLTENPDVSVLLLENGGEPGFLTEIPLFAGPLEFSSYNYGYKSQPQEGYCKGCKEGRLEWPHGNVLGGSSVINYMIYVRGNPHDYDKWAEIGNVGWSYKDILPYLIKVEDSHVKDGDAEYRGKGGYLTVTDIPYRSKLVNMYVNACVEAGHDYVDYNGKKQLGVSYIQGTLRNGRRCSTEKSYIQPARNRKKLKIKIHHKVTRILIDHDTKKATGVEYLYKGKRYYAYAKKEVILSAGALNSPQVLMLSGIGPEDHLNELGIPVVQDLPVGKKMYDHASFPAIIFELDSNVVVNLVREALNPITYIKFAAGSGLLTSIGVVEAITYVKTNLSTDPEPGYPDIELLMLGGSLNSDFGAVFRKIFNIPPEMFEKLFVPLKGKHIYQVTPVVLHPKSYGYIKLNKSDPEGDPLFYPNYFTDSDNHDIKTFIAGIRELQRINLMPSLQKIGAKIVDIPVPGCEDQDFNSDEYWECALRTLIGSYYHQVATCKMAPESDPEAVVDDRLKVHGIKNLRVIDTSIIPFPPSTHNVGPAYVIGEKGADLIKEEWKI